MELESRLAEKERKGAALMWLIFWLVVAFLVVYLGSREEPPDDPVDRYIKEMKCRREITRVDRKEQ